MDRHLIVESKLIGQELRGRQWALNSPEVYDNDDMTLSSAEAHILFGVSPDPQQRSRCHGFDVQLISCLTYLKLKSEARIEFKTSFWSIRKILIK